jgi:hypothetical protein
MIQRGSSGRPPAIHVAIVAILVGSCSGSGGQQTDWTLTGDGFGHLAICTSLDAVDSAFRSARDTVLQSEGAQWPAKIVRLGTGMVLFESSWLDRTRVWTITATSPDVRTSRGYHVGMPLSALKAAGESLAVKVPEGRLLLVLMRDRIALTIDSSSEKRFFSGEHLSGALSIQDVASDARIRSLSTLGGCPQSRE